MEGQFIETENLRIRNLKDADLTAFHEYRSDPHVTKYQGFDVMNLSEAKTFIKKNSSLRFGTPGQWVQYAIEKKATRQLIGDCGICLGADDVRIAQIGITISPAFQNRGFAKETMRGILEFLFAMPDFHRVQETVDTENEASVKLLESCGFRNEGHFIENIFFNGKWGSEFQYAMLRHEWDSQFKK